MPDSVLLLLPQHRHTEWNPAENIWEYLRGKELSHFSYEAIVDACCGGENRTMNPLHVLSINRGPAGIF
jgi:hypothetical protein